MANEIVVTVGLTATKGGLIVNEETEQIQRDMSGTHRIAHTQDIGTTEEALAIPAEVATLGYAKLVNLDSTNYVEVGILSSAVFHPVLKLLPGDKQVVRFSNVALYAKANTAPVKLDFLILEA